VASFRDRIRFPRFRQLYDYWRDIRGPRAMPSRRDIDPLDLKELLGWLLLIDVEWAPLRFRFRLIGTEIVAIRGVDLTGRYLNESVFPAQDIVLKFNTRVATEPCIGFQCALDTMRDARAGCISRLSLPLSADGRQVNMIIGGFEYAPDAQICTPDQFFEPVGEDP
jgi:hypothetical protein